MLLENRSQAGRLLAEKLRSRSWPSQTCVLALPKGGVPVAWEISRALRLPLDLLFVKKIGLPQQEELAIGAVSEGGEAYWQSDALSFLNVSPQERDRLAERARAELNKKAARWRRKHPALDLKDKEVIIVDDGLATGATMKSALQLLKKRGVKRTTVAVPVAATSSLAEIKKWADEIVVLHEPTPFFSVGQWYDEFDQVTDEQVELILSRSGENSIAYDQVEVEIEDLRLPGVLRIPQSPRGLVIFAHGSGSSHLSPRQQKVSQSLYDSGFATLLFDLLSEEESQYRPNLFDIDLLARRLSGATAWCQTIEELSPIPVGYLGASTGAAAALIASINNMEVKSVVSRGGRVDMAGQQKLSQVHVPVLLIVGGDDEPVLSWNREAQKSLLKSELVVIPGAGHLFEEPGALDEVIELATSWFRQTLNPSMAGEQLLAVRPAEEIIEVTKKKAVPLDSERALDAMAEELGRFPIVMLGEATHGTEEFYKIRRQVTERLIQKYGYNFVAVEGDWPDCYRLHRYIQTGEGGNAKSIMSQFTRWPTWMWANEQTAQFIEWARGSGSGFYGLDVYSLFSSLDIVRQYAESLNREARDRILEAYSCFESFDRDEIAYARSLMTMPAGCTEEVVESLRTLLRLRIEETRLHEEQLFELRQNAKIMVNSDRYYRAIIRGDADSWNIRDQHMIDTLEMLFHRYVPGAKAIVWAHNTHIGDYHATDMVEHGYVNLGGLAREKWGIENVCLVGFGTYEGEVLAGRAWGSQPEVMPLPKAPPGTFEYYFHQVAQELGCQSFGVSFQRERAMARIHGHRAVGVVYQPETEKSRRLYVPTKISHRYDKFVFVDKTSALRALPTAREQGLFPETWPSAT